MKKILLLTLAISIVTTSLAQKDFRDGYIITQAKDTIYGYINYKEGAQTYKSCNYRSSKTENVVTYDPGSIIGYGFINDKYFEAKEIILDNQQAQIVFLEVIVRGLVSLYKFEDSFFVEKNNGGLQQLINESTETYLQDRRVIKNSNEHIVTLNTLMFDCPELRDDVQRMQIIEKALTELVEDYNRCKGQPSIIYKAKKSWTKAEVGIMAGMNNSRLTFNSLPYYPYLNGTFEISNSPMIGISVDVLSPRLSERISFHGDLFFLTSRYYNYSLFENSTSVERNYVTIELQQLKIPFGIRYSLSGRKFTTYFNFGLSNTVHLNSYTNWVQEVEYNNLVETYTNQALSINKSQFGLWGGIGLIKSINRSFNSFFEFRYEQTNGISEEIYAQQSPLNSKVTNLQLIIGIRTK